MKQCAEHYICVALRMQIKYGLCEFIAYFVYDILILLSVVHLLGAESSHIKADSGNTCARGLLPSHELRVVFLVGQAISWNVGNAHGNLVGSRAWIVSLPAAAADCGSLRGSKAEGRRCISQNLFG